MLVNPFGPYHLYVWLAKLVALTLTLSPTHTRLLALVKDILGDCLIVIVIVSETGVQVPFEAVNVKLTVPLALSALDNV